MKRSTSCLRSTRLAISSPICFKVEKNNERRYHIYDYGRVSSPVIDETIECPVGTVLTLTWGTDTRTTHYVFNNDFISWICDSISVGENYATGQEGVADSLIQRLSVIKGELWYKASYGLPLLEKIKNKGIYDNVIISIITSHPNVVNLTYYNSTIDEKRRYVLDFAVYTTYNEEVKIQYTI